MAQPVRAVRAPVQPAAHRPPHELPRREKALALTGVLLALLLAALDQTIVSTAGPAIQRDLAIPPALYPWITTAYLVASTVLVPIYGKLSDRLGRRPVLVAGVVIFLAGSLLCGIAPTTGTLVAARAVQGLGAASLFTSAFAVIADLFTGAERGKYMGFVGAVMGLASVVGPLAGGFITDNFGWHWAFFVNLPVGAVALWVILTHMPPLAPAPVAGARPPLDVAGALALVFAVVPLLVALSLGRSGPPDGSGGFAWGSWPIVAMLGVAAVGITTFLAVERRARDPILDLRLFRNRTIGLGTAATFVLGAAFLSSVVFLPLFMVNVVGVSATRAGLTMMPLTMGVVAGSVLTGQVLARAGRYRPVMLGALGLLLLGFAVMGFTLTAESTQAEVTIKMILLGLGVGPTFPVYTLLVQGAAGPRDIGVVTAATTFARSLGQVIGVAALGSVFAATLGGALGRETSAALGALSPDARAIVARALPGAGAARMGGEAEDAGAAFDATAVRARVRQVAGQPAAPAIAEALGAVDRIERGHAAAFTTATRALYRIGIAVVLLAFAISLFIPEARVRPGPRPPAATMLE